VTITFIVLMAALAMMSVEAASPGRSWPRVAGWWARAWLATGVQAGGVFLAGAVWNKWLLRHQPWSANALGEVGGALAGYLVITFVYYWWHRWRHESDFLWRWLHQLHHSAQRIEIITSFYKHPFEIVADGLISTAVLYWIVGLGPVAAAGATLIGALAELFYHWNVRTPYWLGFVLQRPESHCVHHQEGLHSFNYSDLPLWDILFGTFRNPRQFDERCGFGESEHRVEEMLRGLDVTGSSAGAL